MHQHKVSVLELSRKQTDLRLHIRTRIIVRNDQLTVGRILLLREWVTSAKGQNIKIVVQTANERAVIVRHNNISGT